MEEKSTHCNDLKSQYASHYIEWQGLPFLITTKIARIGIKSYNTNNRLLTRDIFLQDIKKLKVKVCNWLSGESFL
jgi:hypothetical protein